MPTAPIEPHHTNIDIRLPTDCDGKLVQLLVQVLSQHSYSTQLQLLNVGRGQRLRLLGTPPGAPVCKGTSTSDSTTGKDAQPSGEQ